MQGTSPSKTFGEESAKVVTKPVSATESGKRDLATFAGGGNLIASFSFFRSFKASLFGSGCFWGIELAFQRVPGVVKTEVVSWSAIPKANIGAILIRHTYDRDTLRV
jgi:hypothetical protein